MTRAQLEHLIRAAGTIVSDDTVVVIGSQAILGQYPDAPATLRMSVEADLFPLHHPERADLIDGSIGELSPFHSTFGYYAQGVAEQTATLPAGWKERLVPVSNPNTMGVTGLCLDAHDLVVSKCIAGRAKDWAFLRDAVRHGLVQRDLLLHRLDAVDRVDDELRRRVRAGIERACAAP